MSFSRRYFNMSRPGGDRAPSDEMLAVDAAAGELRSFTILYDRYADRLYRYFLICTGDAHRADTLMRSFLRQLRRDLPGFRSEDSSFAGWLFRRASRRLNQERSHFLRIYRRFFESASASSEAGSDNSRWSPSGESGFERINAALRQISDGDREVIAINLGAKLGTMPTSEALRLPASLVSSHVNQAVRKLGEALDDSSDPARLSQHLQEVFSGLTVSGPQRQQHLVLLHSLFYGGEDLVDEVEFEEAKSRSTLIRDISALTAVVLLGLAGIWVWGLFSPGDPRMPDPPPEVSIGSQPDPTATPVATPEPDSETEVAAGADRDVCMAYESKRIFDMFIRQYNAGEFDALYRMLPGKDYENPLYGDANGESDAGPDAFFRLQDASFSDRDDVIDFLRGRHESGERWNVVQAFPAEYYRNIHGASPIEMYVQWKQDNPELGIIVIGAMERSADDFLTHKALGRAIIDCAEQMVIEWNVQSNESLAPEPVGVDEFLSVMGDLGPGEQREIRALVSTDKRDDGGALTDWEIRWRQAVLRDGTELERVDVRMLDGSEVITYVHGGHRWRLDHRGWVTYGGEDDALLPEEISSSLPWIAAVTGYLEDHRDEIGDDDSTTLSRDLSGSGTSGTERWFELDVEEGRIVAVRLRETTPNGASVRPEIQFLRVDRSERFDPNDFNVPFEPRFPELEVDAPRYRVPVGQYEQLEVIEMVVGSDQSREEYRLRWNDVEFDLVVMPSRGGLDPDSIPPGVDVSWVTAIAEYEYGQLVWAHRHFAGYPTDAVWDDGRYRFELAVDRNTITPEHEWSLGRLTELVNALSGSHARDVSSSDSPYLSSRPPGGSQGNRHRPR